MHHCKSLVAALAIAVVVLGSSRAEAQTTVTIDVFNFDFGNFSTLTHIDPVINVGDTVTWNWSQGIHSTTAALHQADFWDSGIQVPAFTFSHTFLVPGTFNYYCQVHGFDNGDGTVGGMSGHVTVNPVPEPSWILLTGGLVGTMAFRRRRRSDVDAAVESRSSGKS